MLVLLFKKFDIPARRSESGLSGVAWSRWRLKCADLYVGQEVRPRTNGEKGTAEVLPFWRSMRSLSFKKLRSDYEVEVSPLKAKSGTLLFSKNVHVKSNRKGLLCKRNSEGRVNLGTPYASRTR
ncbi:MAG: hypothetical protein DMG70_32750 [Acidobacteria bacterium]|nr:MAG: hypothetical protein DMG70_32750 [Acidobacteriota bacterium]